MPRPKIKDRVNRWKARIHVAREKMKPEVEAGADRMRLYADGGTRNFGFADGPAGDAKPWDLRLNHTFRTVKAQAIQTAFRMPRVELRASKPGPPVYVWEDLAQQPGFPQQIVQRAQQLRLDTSGTVEEEDLVRALESAGVKPSFFAWVENAEVNEAAVNKFLRTNKAQEELETCVIEAFAVNSFIEVTYVPDVRDVTVEGEKKQIPLSESISIKRLSPKDVAIDPAAKSLDDARWVAIRKKLSPKLMKNSSRYENTSDLKTDSTIEGITEMAEKFDIPVPEEDTFVNTWHIWDVEEGKFYVISEDGEKFHRRLSIDEMGYKETRHPLSMLRYNVLPGNFWGISELGLLSDVQDAYNANRTQGTDQVRRGQPKIFVAKDLLDPENQERLISPDSFAIVYTNGPLKGQVQEVSPQGTPQQIIAESQQLLADFQLISGVGANQLGTGANVETAREAAIVEANTRLRGSEKAKKVISFIRDIARRILDLVQNKLANPHFIRIAGEEGEEETFRRVTKKDLEGEFDVVIEIGDTAPKDRNVERSDFIQFLQAAGGVPGAEVHLDTRKLIKEAARLWDQPEETFLRSMKEVAKIMQAQEQAAALQETKDAIRMLLGGKGQGSKAAPLGTPSPPAQRGSPGGGQGGLTNIGGPSAA